jgi:hypothetical protein
LPNVARVYQKNKRTQSLIGNMVFGGFPKKIRNKTFYYHGKKIFTYFFFHLLLALESISGVKSRLFGQTTLNIIFSQKLSNCHISLWRKVIFPFLTQSLIGNMVYGSFPKKIRNKTFYFHTNFFFHFFFFT